MKSRSAVFKQKVFHQKKGKLSFCFNKTFIMFSQKYRSHYRANWSLAYPIVLSQFGHLAVLIADNLMVGHLGSSYLAASSFANNLYSILLLFGVGIASGITPMVGKAIGEGNNRLIRETYFNGFAINLFTGFLILGLIILSMFSFPYMGQDPQVVLLSKPLYLLLGISMIPYMIFLQGKQFIESFEDTKPGMLITIVCNAINIILNFLLIYGLFGFPCLKLVGAGYAILISRTLMALWMLIYVYRKKEYRYFVCRFNIRLIQFRYCLKILKLGIPIAMQYVLEVGFFTLCGIMIGTFGSEALAAYQIVLSLSALTYVMASGIGQAAMIRISNFYGQGDIQSIREVGNTSRLMAAFMMLCFGACFILFRNVIPGFYLSEPAVTGLAAKFFVIVGIYQVFDGIQANMINTLRGLHDVKVPTIIAMLSYWLVALGFSYLFAFTLKIGSIGIWYGMLVGLICAACLLSWRFSSRCIALEKANL